MASNKGFNTDAVSHLAQILNNLKDRYQQGFPIVKELIQNADDAGATQLAIAWVDSAPRADHPLLQGPALLVVNSGKFLARDAKAIRQIGSSDKPSDRSVIGKFG